MRVTIKGQVTIPKAVRDSLEITAHTEVEFREEQGRYYLVNTSKGPQSIDFKQFSGIASSGLSTDEIMQMTRGD